MPASVLRPLAWFKEHPTNLRQFYDPQESQQLHDSLVKKQLVPLICGADGTVYDGHRRLRAARIDGKPPQLETIVIEGNVTEAQVKEIQLETALHRADLKPYEVYCGAKSWLALHPGATAKELAEAISRSESSLVKILSLDRCIPPVKAAAAEGRLGVSDWYAMSRVGEADQAALLAARLSGRITSREQIEAQGRKSRNGGKPAVRVARVKCATPSGVMVTLAGEGEGLTLDDVIETLTELLKEAKKANDQGLDSKTFSAVMRDKAKAG
jgi:ParB family chromosome partitioning protein